MLRKVEVKNFKMFDEQTFDLPEHLVVVGPNNGGKTSLLQAIATWSEIANHWFETNPDFARLDDGNYPAAELNLLRFASVPLRDFPHLWRNKLVTEPVSISVEAEGWRVGFEIVHEATEQAKIRPQKEVRETHLERCKERPPTVVYVPPVSRLPVKERPLTVDAVRASIRSGEISEVLRNVLVAVSRDPAKWKQLQRITDDFFGYELVPPSSSLDVIALYRHRPDGPAYDLSSAASGFLQVLASYAALLFDDASVVLIDEPDAHLHLLLQETTFRKLLGFAARTKSQLVVATHSETIINGVKGEHLRLLWRGFRELPGDKRIGKLLRLKNQVLMLAETEPGILYVEGESDLRNLRAWAEVLGHRLSRFLDAPFWKETAEGQGTDHAVQDFRALQRMVPEIKGVELRDGDKGKGQGEPKDLLRLRWFLWEIENYLLHPSALGRFVRTKQGADAAARLQEYLEQQLPPSLLKAPFNKTGVIASMKGSDVLDAALQEAGLQLKKTDYWQIAAQMHPEEVHPEVIEKLDAIAEHFNIPKAAN